MGNFDNKVISAIMTKSGESERVVGPYLKKIREMVGLTQWQLAQRLGVSRTTISKFEHCRDIKLSTLQNYLEALGARLKIEADFSLDASDGSGVEDQKEQLVLPVFDEVGMGDKRDIVISIRPEFSEKILEGKKTVELRRRFPEESAKGAVAYIYSTSPTMAMVGFAVICNVVKLPVKQIWDRYSDFACIRKKDFDSYFSGIESGYVLELKGAREFSRQVGLQELRDRFRFTPPQSFYYAKPKLIRALQDECPDVSY